MRIHDIAFVIGFVLLGAASGWNAVAAETDSSTIYRWRYRPVVICTDSADKMTDDDSNEQTEAQPMPVDDGDGTTTTMGD